jgi:hypothetical protein
MIPEKEKEEILKMKLSTIRIWVAALTITLTVRQVHNLIISQDLVPL